jgi:hypothetical protein
LGNDVVVMMHTVLPYWVNFLGVDRMRKDECGNVRRFGVKSTLDNEI